MTREEEINIAASKYIEENTVNGYVAISDHKDSFVEGAEWADTNIKSPWISVKDDLPCNNPDNIHFGFTNRVFAIDYDKNIFVAFMTKYNNKWIWCNDNNFDLLRLITHWMPIPKLVNE